MIQTGQCGAFSDKMLTVFAASKDEFEKIKREDETEEPKVVPESHRIKAIVDIQNHVFKEKQIGVWSMEICEGKDNKLFVDEIMEKLICASPDMNPAEVYKTWESIVVPSELERAQQYIIEIQEKGLAEIIYKVNHPTEGIIYAQCGGVLDVSFVDGVKINGYHRHFKTLDEAYNSI